MDFGDAIRALKSGKKVARAGWNGKGMWLSLTEGTKRVPARNMWSPNNREYALSLPDQVVEVLPSITMKTATGEILMGWLASQTDMLAEDWTLVE
jgi:Protein of unknown function (DUF2829)